MRGGITIRQRTPNGEHESYIDLNEHDEMEILPVLGKALLLKIKRASGRVDRWPCTYAAVVLLRGKS